MRPPLRSNSKKPRSLTPELAKEYEDANSNTGSSMSPWGTVTLTSSRKGDDIEEFLQVGHQPSYSNKDRPLSERLKVINAEFEPEVEEEALRFLELPVEKAGGRRRRLLAQLGENTKQMDSWLRRLENREAPKRRVLDSPQPSASFQPCAPKPRRPQRRGFAVHGPVRKGFGIRRPVGTWMDSQSISKEAASSESKPLEEFLEELRFQQEQEQFLPAEERQCESRLETRDDEELMLAEWRCLWHEQEQEERRQSASSRQPPADEQSWCRTPSFGVEAGASVSSPQAIGTSNVSSDEADDFEAEVRLIAAGCGFVQDSSQELFPPGVDPRATPSKHRVTLNPTAGGGSPVRGNLNALSESSDEDAEQKVQAAREERIMKFCPEVMAAALSPESREVATLSLVRGASKVLAEYRGHRKNLERLQQEQDHSLDLQDAFRRRRSSSQSALQRAMALHQRGQCRSLARPWRRRGQTAPPLRAETPRVDDSCTRASPDFTKMRQELPRKEKIIAARRYKKKQEALRQVHTRVTDCGFGVAEKLGRSPVPRRQSVDTRPVSCSPEVASWRSPSPLEQRLQEECNVVAGSQWREYLEAVRFGRLGAQSAKRRPHKHYSERVSKEPSCEHHSDLERQRSLIDSGKVEDCPDAHAEHLLRQGNVQALARWGGLRYARPHVLRKGLFRAVRLGQQSLLSWLLEELSGIFNSNEAIHWREQGGARPTLLHAAAEADLVATCALLEGHGADVQAQDDRGRLPWQVGGPAVRQVWLEHESFQRYLVEPSSALVGTIRVQTSPSTSLAQVAMDAGSTRRHATVPNVTLGPQR